jgi:hypothetical protein
MALAITSVVFLSFSSFFLYLHPAVMSDASSSRANIKRSETNSNRRAAADDAASFIPSSLA